MLEQLKPPVLLGHGRNSTIALHLLQTFEHHGNRMFADASVKTGTGSNQFVLFTLDPGGDRFEPSRPGLSFRFELGREPGDRAGSATSRYNDRAAQSWSSSYVRALKGSAYECLLLALFRELFVPIAADGTHIGLIFQDGFGGPHD